MRNSSNLLWQRRVLGLVYLAVLTTLLGCRQSSSFSGGNNRQGASQTPRADVPSQNAVPTPQTPVPQQAVTQGSFTVWANPPNPVEGQPYNVHVRVKLPNTVNQYNRNDLSGTLVGTDGYFQPINGIFSIIQPFYFVPGTGYAELVMRIPGAKRGVNDTLKVTSKLINESQNISVWFGVPTVN
jgi:hypothetical protein